MIYGVDTTKEVSPEMVRDAIVICFYEAHCAQTEMGSSDDPMTHNYCRQIVEKAFKETGGDFERPTKASIMACAGWLAEFSKSFRDQSVIQKHMSDIQKLISLLKD